MALRGRRVPETALTTEQLKKIVREYVPETIRKMYDARRLPRPTPQSRRALEGRAGHPTVEMFMATDEFWPMLEWAALHLARRFTIADQDTPDRDPADVLEIIERLRGIRVTQRTLDAHRARWAMDADQCRRPPRSLLPGETLTSLSRTEQYRYLERMATEFLRAKPPRPTTRRPKRSPPAYPWLY